MKAAQLFNANNLDIIKSLPDNSIDSIVTDPPYGISFMGKKWDYDVPSVETWKECLRVLKPGGHILVACGTRTQHRMTVNIEDAGFEIRDIVAWIYGSGFPKSLNIGKALDKIKGNSSEIYLMFAETIKNKREELKITLTDADNYVCGGTTNYSWFEGRKGGQRLPKLEEYLKIKELLQLDDSFDNFIGEAEREVIGEVKTNLTVMQNIGQENISGKINLTIPSTDVAKQYEGWGTALKPAMELWTLARKPLSENNIAQNVLKWGTGGINIDGSRVGTTGARTNSNGNRSMYGGNSLLESKTHNLETKEHNYGRFPANVIHDGSDEVTDLFPNDSQRFFYCAKASKSERNDGLDGFEDRRQDEDDYERAGTTNPRNRSQLLRKNFHPTVKPIALMRYLVKMITPIGGMVLDPFMGSGSTGIACMKENFSFTGIELDPEYFRIAEARINNA